MNPSARSERAQRSAERLRTLCHGASFRATLKAGDAQQLARNAVAEGYERIVAAGGDGTIHEVVNGLAGSEAALGLLPLGTMNVFANELGLPANDLGRCWEIIRAARTRLIDLPMANEKHFVQLAGVGLDAQVVKETSLTFKRNFGPLSYLISAAQVASRRPPRLLIESEDALTEEGSFVLVGNGRLYGGPFPFFKHAVIDDGLLDVLVFKQIGYLDLLKYIQNVIFTSDITTREVEYFQTRYLRVSSAEEVPLELDGELAGACPVEFAINSRRLKVLTP
ncbi:MAG: diacylglycerol kinase family lipid kinase [Chthoniobacterales bacterium]|nr:diacylglycerol kinase family lipid kinase [Chthoniobacterales bacterium]